MSGDGADLHLRIQREETIARNRQDRVDQLRQGQQERARLLDYYAARREQTTSERS